jgi:hypothetical protein
MLRPPLQRERSIDIVQDVPGRALEVSCEMSLVKIAETLGETWKADVSLHFET